MWFYHRCGEINKLLKNSRFRLTKCVLLFTQAVPRIFPMPHHLVKHLVLRGKEELIKKLIAKIQVWSGG